MLQDSISITENKNVVSFPPNVWTNTDAAGLISGADHCENWSSLMPMGSYGVATATDATWTDAGVKNCTNGYRLYCVEQ